MEHKIEKKIKERKEYIERETENSATDEERKAIFSEILTNLSTKNRIKK